MAARLELTQRSVQLQVQRLERLGVLREVTGRERDRLFVASEIVDVLEGAPWAD